MGAAVPIIYGDQRNGTLVDDRRVSLPLDIFGSAFFMLARYEELVLPDHDGHGRFPAAASTAFAANFLHRPIIDEYVEILWAAMKRLWPDLERKKHTPRTLVSCDLDSPYVCGNGTAIGALWRMVADLVERRSPRLAMQTAASGLRSRKGDYSLDPCMRATEWMMEVNEQAGNRVAFYFITDHSHPRLDGCYSMDQPQIRALVRRIGARGHEIGLHASYESYRDAAQFGREVGILQRVMEKEGVRQDEIGGRQHFLRWETPITARNWEAAGMNYDSTLSYAERPGFRCGTCREYPMFDPVERKALNLRQRPLVLMECSVTAKRYLGLGHTDEALALMKSYKDVCHRFQGDFTLLWHNSQLLTAADRRFYRELIC